MSGDSVMMKAKDYKSTVEPVWCPGCGDFGDLAAFTQALADLRIKPENMAIISGIGCSGRFSHFINCYAVPNPGRNDIQNTEESIKCSSWMAQ